MITIVCSSQHPLDMFKQHVIKMSGMGKNKIEFLGYENKGEFSLTEIYNRGLNAAKNDIVVFLHDDLVIETHNFGNKLLKLFNNNPEYGVIGVAGTKNMPTSGQWWENKRKMYGRVAHTHEGKTWLSKYSEDLGQHLEDVIIVDGVFFAVDKRKLKTGFNETVEGFHFYDITFCFENYLKDVKIGVTTVIRINHNSIGMTNEKWEENRVKFINEFKDNLPVNIKRTLNNNKKLKILIGCLSFNHYTGSELYVFELAKQLVKQGHDVTICSNFGNPLGVLAKELGIKLYNLNEPPGFKLGDGKWKLKSADGEIVSKTNTLYKLNDIVFDVIHLNHKPVTEHLLRLYPDTPVICSIHSEVINLEEPVISPQIKKYIAIRPEIKEYITTKFGIKADMVDIIYNPIDSDKFKIVTSNKKHDKKRILFVGTIDYLRKETIQSLIDITHINNQELWIVGKKNDNYLDAMLTGQDHVKYFPPTNNVNELIHQCDEVAGILLGRTTIEGWLCGKPAWIYDVNESGTIKSRELHNPPADIDKFKSDLVVKEIIKEYESLLD